MIKLFNKLDYWKKHKEKFSNKKIRLSIQNNIKSYSNLLFEI